MPLRFWDKRSFWDRGEIVSACLAAGLSALTASLTQDYKRIPASLAFACAAFTAFFKWQSKKIEERDKQRKAEEEYQEKEERSRELDRLQKEHAASIEGREVELRRIRDDADRRLRKTIQVILEDFHWKYFRREQGGEKHKHRTTLFACVEDGTDGATSKRLTIYARVGVYAESKCSWPVDDNEPDKCRGIAGKIWFHGVGSTMTTACDWPADGNAIQKAQYASSLGITVDEAEALNVKSKVFTGARIMARDQKWGVILLDSLKEGHICDASYEKKLLGECANLISSVLTRIEP